MKTNDITKAEIAAKESATVDIEHRRAPEVEPAELRKANRHERRALAAQARKSNKKFKNKTFTHHEAETTEPEPKEVIELLDFVGESTRVLNGAVAQIEKLRARVVAHERNEAEPLGIALAMAFMIGRMEAYTPKSRHDEMFARALALKSKFNFKTSDGQIVKPKEESLIVTPPPLIIPATR